MFQSSQQSKTSKEGLDKNKQGVKQPKEESIQGNFGGNEEGHKRPAVDRSKMLEGYGRAINLWLQPEQSMTGEEEVPKQGKLTQMKKQTEQEKFGGNREVHKRPAVDRSKMLEGYAKRLNQNTNPAQLMVREEEEVQAKTDSENQGQPKTSAGSRTQMPEGVQAKMENSFGTHFDNVNIHTNDNSATDMGALAFTQGNNVHFAPGQYNPDTQKGQELLGHELTHVVQQRQGRVQPTKQGKGMAVNDSPGLENEADVMGAKAAQGKSVEVEGIGTGVQRKTKQELVNDISQYDDYIKSASKKYGVSVNQIKAIIAVESGGLSEATSGAAYGLMQVTKSTWGYVQKKYSELNNYDFDTYWKNPKINILFGTAVFKGKMKTVGVSADDENFASLAITAYNAGEGTVKLAIQNARNDGSKDPTNDCLKPEYLKPAIEHYGIHSYYLTGKGKKWNKTKTKKEAIQLKYKEISRYPDKVNDYLAILNGDKKEISWKPDLNTKKTAIETEEGVVGTYYYSVEKGYGNDMIASKFGVSQADIENANKELHKSRGNQGYFYPDDKIIIPNPTKNVDKLMSASTYKDSEQNKEKPQASTSVDLNNIAKRTLTLLNPMLMGTLKLGKFLYDKYTSSTEQNKEGVRTSSNVQDQDVNSSKELAILKTSLNDKGSIALDNENTLYEVKKGEGNAKIAEKFGITLKELEEANKDLYQKRGGKGWFWAGDKIIIPSPKKQPETQKVKEENIGSNPKEDNAVSISSSDCWDNISTSRLSKIHSKLQADAFKFINTLDKKHNIKVRVTQGLRTIAEQNSLYNKGRDKNGNVTDKSKIVTNAKGGYSYHNFGLAFDIVEIKDGKALWTNPNWSKIGEVGKSFGFEWGGDWTSLVDKPHFQNKLGYSLSQLRSLNAQGNWNL